MEKVKREFLCGSSRALKMESSFDAISERECSICFFDLHLSAAGCRCSPDRYACLDHAKHLCSCSLDSKFFLFRYDISELNILVEALEGKLSAVYRWAKSDLGLALTSYVSADKETILKEWRFHSSNSSHSSRASANKEVTLDPSKKFTKDSQLIIVPIKDKANSANSKDRSYLQQRKPVVLALSPYSHMKEKLTFNSSKPACEMDNSEICVNKGESVSCGSNPTTVCELSQEDSSYALSLSQAQHGGEKSSLYKRNSIILSDDKDVEMKMLDSDRRKELPHMLAGSRNKASPCNNEDTNLTLAVTDVVRSEKDTITLPCEDMSSGSTQLLHVKQESLEQREGPGPASTPVDLSFHIGLTSAESVRNIPASSTAGGSNHCLESLEICPNRQHSGTAKVKNEDNDEKFGGCATSNVADNARAVNENVSCSVNNHRQKGPRIAKVVRRINCNVEPLEFGVVLSGKSWCSSKAIFPKGIYTYI